MNIDLLKVDFSKYESPITKIVGKAIEEMQTRMIQQEEDRLIMECRETVGFYINKDELIRALNYDRDQFAKGYEAGLNADRWISVKDQLPEEGEYDHGANWERLVLVTGYLTFDPKKERFVTIMPAESVMSKCDINDIHIVAWQPLPNPPEVGDEE